MATYYFDTEIAKEYGSSDIAVIVANLDHWLSHNAANHKHFHDGKYWTYNSANAFTELFEWLSSRQIYRLITKMKDFNIIEVGNYNQHKYDQTRWYTFTDAFLKRWKSSLQYVKLLLPKSVNEDTEIDKPIPDNKPYSKLESARKENLNTATPIGPIKEKRNGFLNPGMANVVEYVPVGINSKEVFDYVSAMITKDPEWWLDLKKYCKILTMKRDDVETTIKMWAAHVVEKDKAVLRNESIAIESLKKWLLRQSAFKNA